MWRRHPGARREDVRQDHHQRPAAHAGRRRSHAATRFERESRSRSTAITTTHNRMRPLARGPGHLRSTFSRMCAASPAAARSRIGGNFDASSVGSFPALLEFLREQDFADKLSNVTLQADLQGRAAEAEGVHSAHAGRRVEPAAERKPQGRGQCGPRPGVRQLRPRARRPGGLPAGRDQTSRVPDARRPAQRPLQTSTSSTRIRSDRTARSTAVPASPVAGDVDRPHRRPQGRVAGTAREQFLRLSPLEGMRRLLRFCPCARAGAWRCRHSHLGDMQKSRRVTRARSNRHSFRWRIPRPAPWRRRYHQCESCREKVEPGETDGTRRGAPASSTRSR